MQRSKILSPVPLFALALASLTAVGCGQEGPLAAGDPPIADQTAAVINANDPPPPPVVSMIATGQPDANGGVAVTLRATYSAAAAKSIGKTLTLTLDQQQRLVLHDDGLAPDSKASDGVFSASTQANTNVMRQYAATLTLRAQQFGKTPAWNSRSQGSSVVQTTFDLTGFLAGKVVVVPPVLGFSFIVNKDASLMITNPAVVNDPTRTNNNPCAGGGTPGGPWTFGAQMTKLAVAAGNPDAAAFTQSWLNQWLKNQTINGWTVTARPNMTSVLINPWPKVLGKLDLSRAPFRLLAIVNRVDLRNNSVYGSTNAGEGRMVYGALNPATCAPLPFTVIFEYGITRTACSAVKAWGQQWKDLDALPVGSAAYNAALQALTDQFTRLNQLRTNEIALASPWRLDEFHLSGTNLARVVVAQTPDLSLNNSATVASFVNSGATTVPLTFPTASDPFKGGAALTPFGIFWKAAGIASIEARRIFSLNTCNGCHAGETATVFTHVSPTGPLGSAASLSGFLTGVTVANPPGAAAPPAPTNTYNDLERRAADLDALINSSCAAPIPINDLLFRRLGFIH